jgi:hypothetical protein
MASDSGKRDILISPVSAQNLSWRVDPTESTTARRCEGNNWQVQDLPHKQLLLLR